MITITGATGALNGATTDHLLERVPAREVTVVTRDPAKAQRFADRGVTVRQGDYADPGSLLGAFADADQLLLGQEQREPHARPVDRTDDLVGVVVADLRVALLRQLRLQLGARPAVVRADRGQGQLLHSEP